MRESTPQAIHLSEYTPPSWRIDTVELEFQIFDGYTEVSADLALRRCGNVPGPLVLDGEDLETLSVAIDGRELAAGEYEVTALRLVIAAAPEAFQLRTRVRIRPDDNTRLSGMFRSKDGYFTQCEAQGFRRITWFLDRPDVMSRYTVTLHGDRARYPVLLANGNLVESGDAAGGRHYARWQDPFPKPCYLFALVAGKLDRLDDHFVTRSGRRAALSIFVEPGKLDQCDFAMHALKKSMAWDEQRFGLELDLDCYMIVAVGDFNMGAMENKGLNIFNTKYVLARPDTATDVDYQGIDRVVAHEYFHNWTGNRVTCRDWFQLSLKEGLTVFRDQEYGADMYSRWVARIQEVRGLRAGQFPEDAGPMAHPVRPASYVEINNFYTATVYEKGAEVVRMMHTLLGEEKFQAGMRLYFERHDGSAVTCDDFAQAMQDASGIDLAQFRHWYAQAGTPRVSARGHYDAASRRYRLTLAQNCPPTAYERTLEREGVAYRREPFHIPVAVGLLGPEGAELAATEVLSLTAPEQEFVFESVDAPPVASILRGFSAPVLLDYEQTDEELALLMAHDSDPFNRWEAGQRLATRLMLAGVAALQAGGTVEVPEFFVAAVARTLARGADDPAFAAEALLLPSEIWLGDQMDVIDPQAAHGARRAFLSALATRLREQWAAAYARFAVPGPYAPDAAAMGARALRNLALAYLMEAGDAAGLALCVAQFERADNMTDQMAALAQLAQRDCPQRTEALAAFYARWKDEALVVDKWLSVQATSRLPGTPAAVQALLAHPAFDARNPNKIYALVRSFCAANPLHFHAADGSGYRFATDFIAGLDDANPQVAARLARTFDRWRRFDAGRQQQARAALEQLRAMPKISRDLGEVVGRALV
ncbi:MAG: aminopeptidase N [Rhodocyclaceae bacterium]|nr:aminopeptidase N [Rhodocyclaceae bacterium]MBX3668756.1 aminopeptidase N [Rhodocyclaceae bacterium]